MRNLVAALLFLPIISLGQTSATLPDSLRNWNKGGTFGLNFTQASFTNWAAGGDNSVSAQALLSTFLNYKKGSTSWDNTLDLAYGLMQQGKSSLVKKTDDKLDFSSKYGRYAFKKVWYYSALLGFKTQFQPGYSYSGDTSRTLISDIMAPGYMLLAIGMDYKPNTKFSLFMSPLTGRLTFVHDQTLANAGAFGVKAAVRDTAGNIVTPGENLRAEFGSYVRLQYKAEILKNVTLGARLEFFSNYLHHPENIDVNGDLIFTMKVNKYLSSSLTLASIYDDDVMIAVDNNHDGVSDGVGPRLQFRQVLGVGFSVKF